MSLLRNMKCVVEGVENGALCVDLFPPLPPDTPLQPNDDTTPTPFDVRPLSLEHPHTPHTAPCICAPPSHTAYFSFLLSVLRQIVIMDGSMRPCNEHGNSTIAIIGLA